MTRPVLFICIGNSTRSIMTEAILRGIGGDRFAAYSAGTFPAGLLQPLVVPTLLQLGMPMQGLRSKSWTEFVKPSVPVMDVVITLCDHTAAELCLTWPGTPTRQHWSIVDPTGDPMPMRP
jgi:arsenate reductase